MLYDPATANDLKPWLVKSLEPMSVFARSRCLPGTVLICHSFVSRCDAEPGALADYILALLKHAAPESELRKELVVQLEEFLEKGASDPPSSATSPGRSHMASLPLVPPG